VPQCPVAGDANAYWDKFILAKLNVGCIEVTDASSNTVAQYFINNSLIGDKRT